MKPIKQKYNNPQTGDCFAACIASILEIPLEDVPNVANKKNWWNEIDEWLKDRNLRFVEFEEYTDWWMNGLYSIMIGDSPNFDNIRHCVVGLNGKIVHDPAKSNLGIKEPSKANIGVFLVRDPSRKIL